MQSLGGVNAQRLNSIQARASSAPPRVPPLDLKPASRQLPAESRNWLTPRRHHDPVYANRITPRESQPHPPAPLFSTFTSEYRASFSKSRGQQRPASAPRIVGASVTSQQQQQQQLVGGASFMRTFTPRMPATVRPTLTTTMMRPASAR